VGHLVVGKQKDEITRSPKKAKEKPPINKTRYKTLSLGDV
jgi:hypothetical protein